MGGKSEQVRAYALAQVGGPYIYGATAQPCTLAYRMARMDQYPEYADKIRDACPALSGDGVGCSGCQYDGRIAHDCAQLTRYAAQAAPGGAGGKRALCQRAQRAGLLFPGRQPL